MPPSQRTSQTSATLSDDYTSRRIDCYVRDRVPAALAETVEGIRGRLRELRESGIITNYSVSRWPPAHSHTVQPSSDSQQTRDDVVADFETWAVENGYTLAPAFRRQTASTSPLDSNDRCGRFSVPIVALALYQDDTLCGVFPSTETDSGVTYTVIDCLDALETQGYEALQRSSSKPARSTPAKGESP